MLWKILLACLLSFLPIVELRGGIPFAILSGLNPWFAFFLCVLINILIIPFAFFFLSKLHNAFLNYKIYRKTFNVLIESSKRKSDKVKRNINLFGFIALTFFVAIPLPGTGAWTGSIIAWFLQLDKKKAFYSISLGVLIAGLIVTLAVTGIIEFFKIFL